MVPTLFLLWCPTLIHAAASHPSPATAGWRSLSLGPAFPENSYSTEWRFPLIPQLGTKALDPRPRGQLCSQSQVQSPQEAGRSASSRQCVLTKGRTSAQRPHQIPAHCSVPARPRPAAAWAQGRTCPSGKVLSKPSLSHTRVMFYLYLGSQTDILPLGSNFQCC